MIRYLDGRLLTESEASSVKILLELGVLKELYSDFPEFHTRYYWEGTLVAVKNREGHIVILRTFWDRLEPL
jgi:hypothetical protein